MNPSIVSLSPARAGSFHEESESHVEVEIETRRSQDLQCVPAGAIFKEGSDFSVHVVEGERAILKKLENGRRNDLWVELKSGLAEGAEVVVYPGDLVRPGSRVKASKKAT